jgi:hypothetical protein
LDCATSALSVLPPGTSLATLPAASELPQISPNNWFWLAVVEMQRGQVRAPLP